MAFSSITSAFGVIIFCFFMTSALVLLGLVLGQNSKGEWAKHVSFECGFDPLSSSRNPFSLRFFLLALLFLVFDMEVVLILPFIFSLKVIYIKMGWFTKAGAVLIALLLFLGLAHEFNEGTLDWEEDK